MSHMEITMKTRIIAANSIRYQIDASCKITVIEWFADAGFLPRYGFPIHVQRLSVRKTRDNNPAKSTAAETYRLERQSLLALSHMYLVHRCWRVGK